MNNNIWRNHFRKFVYKQSKEHYNWPLFGDTNNLYTENRKDLKYIKNTLKKQEQKIKKMYDVSRR